MQRLEDQKLNKAGGDLHGHLRFNSSDSQRLYGASRAARHTVVLKGNWDELEVKGRVLDWTGGDLHIGFDNDHATHSIQIGRRVGQTILYSGGGTAETMRLQGGNVGVGTNNPGVKLQVRGNRIRLEKPGSTQTLDLRADGGALDTLATMLTFKSGARLGRFATLPPMWDALWYDSTMVQGGTLKIWSLG